MRKPNGESRSVVKSGKNKPYIPERGDLVWVSFTPQAGHEQSGRRQALVLTPGDYNVRSGLALMCPITSRIKGYPFEVILPKGSEISGAILTDQVKSLDWRKREAIFIDRVGKSLMTEVIDLVMTLLHEED